MEVLIRLSTTMLHTSSSELQSIWLIYKISFISWDHHIQYIFLLLSISGVWRRLILRTQSAQESSSWGSRHVHLFLFWLLINILVLILFIRLWFPLIIFIFALINLLRLLLRVRHSFLLLFSPNCLILILILIIVSLCQSVLLVVLTISRSFILCGDHPHL